MPKRESKRIEPVITVLEFVTSCVGDTIKNREGEYVIKSKSMCERWLDLVPSNHQAHAYPTRMSEFNFNQAQFQLVKGL